MHFLEQNDSVTALERREIQRFFQTANLIDFDRRAVRSNAHEIRVIARLEFQATGTRPAWPVGLRLAAQKSGGEVKGDCGFTYTLRTGKKIGVSQPSAAPCTAQKGKGFGLAKNRGKRHGSEQALLTLGNRF